MRFDQHLISSAILAVCLYPRQPISAALFIAGGVLIDLDHLALYISRTGDWSVSGALHYNRYRNRLPQRGDNRPRYGSLRSWLHQPLLVVPALWAFAQHHRWMRPLAAGVTLHLFLDHLAMPAIWAAYLHAGGRCVRCGSKQRVEVYRRQIQHRQGWHWVALCRRCANDRRAFTDVFDSDAEGNTWWSTTACRSSSRTAPTPLTDMGTSHRSAAT